MFTLNSEGPTDINDNNYPQCLQERSRLGWALVDHFYCSRLGWSFKKGMNSTVSQSWYLIQFLASSLQMCSQVAYDLGWNCLFFPSFLLFLSFYLSLHGIDREDCMRGLLSSGTLLNFSVERHAYVIADFAEISDISDDVVLSAGHLFFFLFFTVPFLCENSPKILFISLFNNPWECVEEFDSDFSQLKEKNWWKCAGMRVPSLCHLKFRLYYVPTLSICNKCLHFGGTYTKIGTIQRRLAWPLRKDDTQNREAFHIFCPGPSQGVAHCRTGKHR